jgi:hypothetical protein
LFLSEYAEVIVRGYLGLLQKIVLQYVMVSFKKFLLILFYISSIIETWKPKTHSLL